MLRRIQNGPSPSFTLEGGGNKPFARDQPLIPDLEQYELTDYKRIQEGRDLESRAAKRAERRADKVQRLDEADNMKFSHSIQFNAVPDWSSHYIAYSNLKKLFV